MAKDGRLKRTTLPSGRNDWNDEDVYALAGFNPKTQVNVIYARTEPLDRDSVVHKGDYGVISAETRLEQQKERLQDYCKARGIQVDVVIGEVRRVNRVRYVNGVPTPGWNALMGLLLDRRVRTLIIESRDRISVGASWEMLEWMLKSVCGIEVIVVNKTLVTTESREESKYWIADMLQVHKAMTGELKDKRLLEQFVGGPDLGVSLQAVKRLDEKLREKLAAERAGRVPRAKRQPVDLDEIFA